MKIAAAFLGLFVIMPLSAASAEEAHVHGAATMNLSVEGPIVEIEISSPLANFISFEHAPETEAQKQEIRDMAARLNAAESLFIFPEKAGCRLREIELSSEVIDDALLASGGAARKERGHDDNDDDHGEEGHGDIDLDAAFVCASPAQLNSLEVALFGHFSSLRELEAQMVTPNGQAARELTPEANVLKW